MNEYSDKAYADRTQKQLDQARIDIDTLIKENQQLKAQVAELLAMLRAPVMNHIYDSQHPPSFSEMEFMKTQKNKLLTSLVDKLPWNAVIRIEIP